MVKIKIIEHIKHSVNYTIFDVKWLPDSAKFLVLGSTSNRTGILEIYEINGAQVNLVKDIQKLNGFTCGAFGASQLNNRQFTIGDYLGRLQILDLEQPAIPLFNIMAHKSIINSIDTAGGTKTDCGAPEIVTGSRDGSVKIWDPRQGNAPVIDITPESPNEGGLRECWAVSFGDTFNNYNRCVAAGYDNGDLRLFDLRTLGVRWETTERYGICSIEFNEKYSAMNRIAVTTLEGGLIVYKNTEKGFEPIFKENIEKNIEWDDIISGPKATVWTVKHLPQNSNMFATCGGTGTLRFWKTNVKKFSGDLQVEMLNATSLSSQPMKCFDWNPNKVGLAVAGSFDKNVRVVRTTC